MAFSRTVRSVVGAGDGGFQIHQPAVGGSMVQIDEVVGADDNVSIALDIDVSALKLFAISLTGVDASTGDVTVSFTGSSLTYVVMADNGWTWVNGYGPANPFNADVTALSVENTTLAPVRVQIEVLSDPTP